MKIYYIAVDGNVPAWVKPVAFGSLAYFGLPIDAIPDITPVLGYTDDMGVLLGAYKAMSSHALPKHEQQAIDKWNSLTK